METELLIIDDDEIVLMLHSHSAISGGLHSSPISFSDPLAALSYLANNHNAKKVLLLLLDINMPEMNAWELLDQINLKAIDTGVLVVIVTSSVDPDDKIKASEYKQVIEFLEKPFTKETAKKLKTHDALKGVYN